MKIFTKMSVLGALLLSACSNSTGVTNMTIYEDMEKDGAKFYVARPFLDTKENTLITQIKDAVSKYRVVYTGKDVESVTEAVSNAKALDANYVIYPTLNEWSSVNERGKAYQANVNFDATLYDVKTGKPVNKANFSRECVFKTPIFTTSECVNLELWIDRVIK